MNEDMKSINEIQKDSWNKVSAAWKKWDSFTMNFLKPMGEGIIGALEIKADDIVLDIASGTGEPAFSIAALATNGQVYATDLSEEMLAIARGYAAERRINNISFTTADVSDLPFPDNFFNKLSCRMGFMFFPDMALAAGEMFRVCKTGAKVAVSVWNLAEKNDWYTTMTKVLSRHLDLAPSSPDAPGMFRCANQGLMQNLFEQARFKNIVVEEISGTVDFGNAENYWLNRTEISESVISLLSKTNDATREKIKEEVIRECNKNEVSKSLPMNYSSLVISAEK